jgi:hypothetical protein
MDKNVWHLSRRDEYPLHTPPSIFFMNHYADDSGAGAQFEGMTHASAKRNKKDEIMLKVMQTYQDCKIKGRPGRLPNFISVDLFEFGENGGVRGACEAVNDMWKTE